MTQTWSAWHSRTGGQGLSLAAAVPLKQRANYQVISFHKIAAPARRSSSLTCTWRTGRIVLPQGTSTTFATFVKWCQSQTTSSFTALLAWGGPGPWPFVCTFTTTSSVTASRSKLFPRRSARLSTSSGYKGTPFASKPLNNSSSSLASPTNAPPSLRPRIWPSDR